MPDRRTPDGRDTERDGPDYHWLYGGGDGGDEAAPPTRPVRRPPAAPDQTRVMRTQSRPVDPRSQATARPTPPPLAPAPAPPRARTSDGRPPAGPPAPPRARRGARRWRPRFRFRYLLLLLLVWVVYIVAVPILAWHSVDSISFEPGGTRPSDQPGTTYLLVGSDSRKGLTAAQRKEFHTGGDVGQRTDTIMLLHTGSGPNLLMSIPRDSQVQIPGHGTTKINAAYAYGGAKLLTQTIEQDTGIRVDQFVEIGMAGVAGIVDAVGGIQVCPTQNMNDKLAGLHIKKGCQQVDGRTALAYARSRHASQLGDIARVEHQREVVAAVGKKVLSPWTVLNPVRWWRINHAVPDFFGFGDGMGPSRIALWATAMTRVNGDKGLTCSVPIANLDVDWDPVKSKRMFELIKTDQTDKITKSLCSATGGVG